MNNMDGTMDCIRHFSSPLGGLTAASDGDALIGLWFDGQKHFGSTLSPCYEEKPLPVFSETEAWLRLYFSGQKPDFTPKLLLRGTDFQKAVWEILRSIPYGETRTYGEIAQEIRRRPGAGAMSPRAVGGAVGRNPISLIIPCHRVMGSGGKITGYAGGIDKKIRLLQWERADRFEEPEGAEEKRQGFCSSGRNR